MTQKELRKIAREQIAEYLKGNKIDATVAQTAVNVLNLPDRKGE